MKKIKFLNNKEINRIQWDKCVLNSINSKVYRLMDPLNHSDVIVTAGGNGLNRAGEDFTFSDSTLNIPFIQ